MQLDGLQMIITMGIIQPGSQHVPVSMASKGAAMPNRLARLAYWHIIERPGTYPQQQLVSMRTWHTPKGWHDWHPCTKHNNEEGAHHKWHTHMA